MFLENRQICRNNKSSSRILQFEETNIWIICETNCEKPRITISKLSRRRQV
ncbi:unnamed protein product [Paramecium octaurelia]|uniref:Uncharacterized protein n=1 Tax=Paramecium octaurelia TaxID=43137 RepID=A0A8S1U4F8_PAROT|nr:unnamed protein product [Paramecium octaurelia]